MISDRTLTGREAKFHMERAATCMQAGCSGALSHSITADEKLHLTSLIESEKSNIIGMPGMSLSRRRDRKVMIRGGGGGSI